MCYLARHASAGFRTVVGSWASELSFFLNFFLFYIYSALFTLMLISAASTVKSIHFCAYICCSTLKFTYAHICKMIDITKVDVKQL